MTATTLLYEGKAKKVYATSDLQCYIVDYKDEATAFNGAKKATLSGKGSLNNRISNSLMQYLQKQGIATHFIQELSPTQTLVKRLDMFALEVIVRNICAGSLAKRLGIKEGTPFEPTIVEFCYKNDSLGDPLINDVHALVLGLASQEELESLKSLALKINTLLQAYFKNLGIMLVDFKLEFGKDGEGNIVLGDEVSPDTCRLWDTRTHQKLDKDRFREDLGGVCEAYEMVLEKMSHS
ncbi:phosphoribosylaminoimidazolesuccinocarboxamide synthase [Helicobacter baculiformis]|uniref:Phosphoribosylaminoimidazole-succinocarboxamide synthase n=1 Tax=Helicobacter baculiformis TaxID=427351 RepID=A0ABV7ZG96_9HELI|nr:phosphoribosylaminoimidazolesuccinocarboxamide synthase [Helicobacter baculiformis]